MTDNAQMAMAMNMQALQEQFRMKEMQAESIIEEERSSSSENNTIEELSSEGSSSEDDNYSHIDSIDSKQRKSKDRTASILHIKYNR